VRTARGRSRAGAAPGPVGRLDSPGDHAEPERIGHALDGGEDRAVVAVMLLKGEAAWPKCAMLDQAADGLGLRRQWPIA
jgi:hypothetical protein